MIFFADENKTLAPTYDIGWEFFDMMVRDHIQQYNYTLNPEGIFNAIKYMYTYYPDPNNRSHIREEFVNVSFSHIYVLGGPAGYREGLLGKVSDHYVN